jgi:cell division protein FtsB
VQEAGAHATRPRRTTTAFDALKGLPDHRWLDGLLRSQAWIWVIGIALGGIVAMQVSLLKLNSQISHDVEAVSTLERQNAELESSVAKLSAGQRIEDAAAEAGMVMPPAGAVEYVKVRPGRDAAWAIKRMQAPSAEAGALLANNGVVPGSLAGTPTTTTTTTATPTTATTTPTTTTPAPAVTPAPATTAPAPTTATSTTPATQPAAGTTTAPAPTAPVTGAAPAPVPGQG